MSWRDLMGFERVASDGVPSASQSQPCRDLNHICDHVSELNSMPRVCHRVRCCGSVERSWLAKFTYQSAVDQHPKSILDYVEYKKYAGALLGHYGVRC